jgi:hypothetical protein
MPDDKLVERLRAVLSRVKSHRLVAWEMRLLEASLTERRKGRGQGTAEALKVLGVRRAEVEEGLHELRVQGADPLVTVALALLADSLRAVDVAEEAYAQLASRIPEAPLLAAVDARLHGRVGVEAVRAACNGALSRATLACFDALRQSGRHNEALAELSRVRALREAPTAYRDAEITTRLALGDAKGATAIYDGMQPTERRMLDLLGYLAAKGDAAAASLRFSRDRVAGPRRPARVPLGEPPARQGARPLVALRGRRKEARGRRQAAGLLARRGHGRAAQGRRVRPRRERPLALRGLRPAARLGHDRRRGRRRPVRAQRRGARVGAPPSATHPQERRTHPRARRRAAREPGRQRSVAARDGRLHRARLRGLGAARRRGAARARHARSPARANERFARRPSASPSRARSRCRCGRTRC